MINTILQIVFISSPQAALLVFLSTITDIDLINIEGDYRKMKPFSALLRLCSL